MKTIYIPKGETVCYENLVTGRIVVNGCLKVLDDIKAKSIAGSGVIYAETVSADDIRVDDLEAASVTCRSLLAKRVQTPQLIASDSAAVSCYLAASYVETGKLTVAASEICEVKADEIIHLPPKKRTLFALLLVSALRSLWTWLTMPAAKDKPVDDEWKPLETDIPRVQAEDPPKPKEWHILFNPIICADNYGRACRYCSILGKELDTRRGNVFYDVKETRIIKGDWLFPDKEVTTVHKGYKVLDRTASLTLCDAIVRYAKHHVIDRFLLNHHHELYFDKSLRYELINFRAQRQNTRDIMQDLADTAAGIEVVHQADAEKLMKEQKRARKEARLAQRVRSLEKLILTGDLDNLTYSQKNGLKKNLSEERIAELMAQRRDKAEQVQTSLFA